MSSITNEMKKKLTEMAVSVSENSYSPYSNFCVGAALICRDGSIYLGTNVENSSYGCANCAERTAIFTAVADKHKEFDAIAIVGHRRGEEISEFCAPCGICRQVMSEFCSLDFIVLLYDGKEIAEYKLKDILPLAFNKEML